MCSVDALGIGYKVIKEASTEPGVGRGWGGNNHREAKACALASMRLHDGESSAQPDVLPISRDATHQKVPTILPLLLGMAQPAANAARELGPEEVGAL